LVKIKSSFNVNGHVGIAKKSASIQEVLDAICDVMSRDLFMTIAERDEEIANLQTSLNLTPKRYHSRISKLLNAKLVKRIGIRYKPTCLGLVIYELLLRLEIAANNKWKLMALDRVYSTNTVPVSDRSRVMDDILEQSEGHNITLNL